MSSLAAVVNDYGNIATESLISKQWHQNNQRVIAQNATTVVENDWDDEESECDYIGSYICNGVTVTDLWDYTEHGELIPVANPDKRSMHNWQAAEAFSYSRDPQKPWADLTGDWLGDEQKIIEGQTHAGHSIWPNFRESYRAGFGAELPHIMTAHWIDFGGSDRKLHALEMYALYLEVQILKYRDALRLFNDISFYTKRGQQFRSPKSLPLRARGQAWVNLFNYVGACEQRAGEVERDIDVLLTTRGRLEYAVEEVCNVFRRWDGARHSVVGTIRTQTVWYVPLLVFDHERFTNILRWAGVEMWGRWDQWADAVD
jgi:hypothetical protein